MDVVVNHLASTQPFNSTNWAALHPFNSPKYYHSPCTSDDSNQTSVITCMIGGPFADVTLPDVKTEDPAIRQTYQEWISSITDKYNVDGLRLDTAKHVEKSFWSDFLQASGVFGLAEWLDGDPKSYPSVLDYLPGAMNYPL